MIDDVKKKVDEQMNKAVDGLKHNLGRIRTGRASAQVLDGIQVNYYGNMSPINQVGQVSTPEARMLQIQPFDKTLIEPIEKAILAANIGMTPSNDGNVIRIPFPALTEERRKEQVKDLKKMAEDSKIAIRNVRRDQNEVIKKLEKDKKISEDDSKKFQTEIQTITDKFIKKVDEIAGTKEKEIMTI